MVVEIDPGSVVTSDDLATQLRLLFAEQHMGIGSFAAKAGLSSDTVFNLINGIVAAPRARTIEAFVGAGCGADPAPWLKARARVIAARRPPATQASPSTPVTTDDPLGQRIGDLTEQGALDLEVHRASAAPAAPSRVTSMPLRSFAEWWRNHSAKRRTLVLTAAVSLVALAVAAVLVQSHSGTSEGPSLESRPEGTSKIEHLDLTAAISDKSYRIILPLLNPQNKAQRLDKMDLLATFQGPPCAEIPYGLIYEMQTPITLDPSGRIKKGSASVESGLAKGFTIPVSGEINWGCGMNQLYLHFRPPGAILAQQSTTSVVVDIPRKITLIKAINGQGVFGTEPEIARLPSMGDPMVDFVAFRAIAVTSSGSRVSSCFLLAASNYHLGSGPQKCDAKIDEDQVYWWSKFGPNRQFQGYERFD